MRGRREFMMIAGMIAGPASCSLMNGKGKLRGTCGIEMDMPITQEEMNSRQKFQTTETITQEGMRDDPRRDKRQPWNRDDSDPKKFEYKGAIVEYEERDDDAMEMDDRITPPPPYRNYER